MKINPALCFKPKELAAVLNIAKNQEDTLTYEIAQAISFRLYFEKYLGWNDYCIYFEPKETKQTELLKQIGTTIKHEDITEFIQSYSEQSTPVDFYFIRLDSVPAEIYPIQAKRFGMRLDPATVTDELIKNFAKWMRQYSPNDATLLIHLQNSGELQIPALNQWLNDNSFPFREVIVQTIGTESQIKLCQLYPNGGDINTIEFTKEQVESV